MKNILVYDVAKQYFRNLDINNYNDDLTLGVVVFERNALEVIKQYAVVCGYVVLLEGNKYIPIDIRKKKIILFEGDYNSLPQSLKRELTEYNIKCKTRNLISKFFIEWQVYGSMSCFENSDSFIQVVSMVFGDQQVLKKIITRKAHLVFPASYNDLCELIQNICFLYDLELNNPKFDDATNYLIDSLENGYRLNMMSNEIENWTYKLCELAISQRRKINE